MEIRPGLVVSDEQIHAFAGRHGVMRMALFGSVLREDFGDQSDVDVLVEFRFDATPGLLTLAKMELELELLFGREVELRTYEDLSRYFRDDVRDSAREMYAA